MGQEFLIDTNIVIASLANKLPTDGAAFIKSLPPAISVITQIELLGWNGASFEELAILNGFIENAMVYPLTPAITGQCILLRRNLINPFAYELPIDFSS